MECNLLLVLIDVVIRQRLGHGRSVRPAISTAQLAGAAFFDQQSRCRFKILTHAGQLSDGFAYSLAMEAFASPSGVAATGDTSLCYKSAPGLTFKDVLALTSVGSSWQRLVFYGALAHVRHLTFRRPRPSPSPPSSPTSTCAFSS